MSKYLILFLIALFFASTNELDKKEAEQHYTTEFHLFIQTDLFTLAPITELHKSYYSKANSSFSLIDFENYGNNNLLKDLYLQQLKFIPQFFSKDIYLESCDLRI
ncbi:MAG: hypothetical protein WCE54_13245 [Ignavibacteriaceae bacterium]